MDKGRVHATTFGGCPSFDPEGTDDSQPKLADTTVLEFGEQNTCHTTLPWNCRTKALRAAIPFGDGLHCKITKITEAGDV